MFVCFVDISRIIDRHSLNFSLGEGCLFVLLILVELLPITV
jgi:hypothetical protein